MSQAHNHGPGGAPLAAPTTERILRLPEVMSTTGISASQIYRRAKAGTFPKPVKLGPNTSGWVESEVQAWVQARIAAGRGADSAAAASASR